MLCQVCSLSDQKKLLVYQQESKTRMRKLETTHFIKPAREALGLLLADGTPTVGGGRLFEPSAKFFYGNSCNSGTESRKIVPKVGN